MPRGDVCNGFPGGPVAQQSLRLLGKCAHRPGLPRHPDPGTPLEVPVHSLHSGAFLWEEASFPQERPLAGGWGRPPSTLPQNQLSTGVSLPAPRSLWFWPCCGHFAWENLFISRGLGEKCQHGAAPSPVTAAPGVPLQVGSGVGGTRALEPQWCCLPTCSVTWSSSSPV